MQIKVGGLDEGGRVQTIDMGVGNQGVFTGGCQKFPEDIGAALLQPGSDVDRVTAESVIDDEGWFHRLNLAGRIPLCLAQVRCRVGFRIRCWCEARLAARLAMGIKKPQYPNEHCGEYKNPPTDCSDGSYWETDANRTC